MTKTKKQHLTDDKLSLDDFLNRVYDRINKKRDKPVRTYKPAYIENTPDINKYKD